MKRSNRVYVALAALCISAGAIPAQAQQKPVTIQVQVVSSDARKGSKVSGSAANFSNVVVWLTPFDAAGKLAKGTAADRPAPQLAQRNKSFEPHLLVVQAGAVVQFPNEDPFFHNVFSLFDGKRFDLGLYEAGTTRSVHFDRPGVSFLFCNIHPEMSAVVVAVDTPYFGISDRAGRVAVSDVPDGRYQMHVWYERSLPENLKTLERVVTVSDSSRSLEAIQVAVNPDFTLDHKNKYGQDYVPPPNSAY